jgi:lysophospholipase L1-like esterase
VAAPTRILIFGQSNTGGVQLGDPQAAWPNLLAAALPELTGRPVDLTVRPFFAHAPGSDAYLERELKKHDPDIVFLMLTTFPFLTRVIEPAVRRRFGERAGDIFHSLSSGLDDSTRNRGRLAGKVNETGRALALRLLPAETITSYGVALEGTSSALRLLARQEHIQAVAVHGVVKLPARRDGKRSEKEVQMWRFLDDVRELAARLHIAFINLQDGNVPKSWFMPDGLHVTAEAHRAIAAAVLAAFRDGRLCVDEPPG